MDANKKLSVLHLVNSFGEMSIELKEFAIPLMKQQNITVCSFFPTDTEMPTMIKFYDGGGSIVGYFRALRKVLSTTDFDIIHSHYAHVSMFLVLFCLLGHFSFLRSTIYTVHTSYSNLKPRNRMLTAITFLFFKRIVFCSKSSEASFPRWFKWLANKRYSTIPNGVNLEKVAQINGSSAHPKGSGVFSIAFVGRLIPLKNVPTLLNAVVLLGDPQIQVNIIGDGSSRDELAGLVEKLGLSGQVLLTGLLAREGVYQLLAKSDLFVSVSRVEGLPVAVLEAMASRCPIILSNIPSHREIKGDTDWIPLVSPDDIEELAVQIRRFRDMSFAERMEVGNKNRRMVEERFSLERALQQYQALYATLIQSEAGVPG